jgi:hypothetical protein
MDRVLRGSAATIKFTFQVDGTATDPSPDTAKIGIVRDDGTEVVAPGTSVVNDGTGVFSYTLDPGDTSQLDILKASWTLTYAGVQQTFDTYVEVVGGYLFSIADARKIQPFKSDTTNYTAADISAIRTMAEIALEDVIGTAFVPRYRRQVIDGTGRALMFLNVPRPITIRSVKQSGVAFGSTQLAQVQMRPTGSLFLPTGWTSGVGNYEIVYEHGFPYPPPRVSRAALLLAKRWLVDGPYDDRATAISTEDGTFSLVTPGVRGAMFDIPEVNAVVAEYSVNMALVG